MRALLVLASIALLTACSIQVGDDRPLTGDDAATTVGDAGGASPDAAAQEDGAVEEGPPDAAESEEDAATSEEDAATSEDATAQPDGSEALDASQEESGEDASADTGQPMQPDVGQPDAGQPDSGRPDAGGAPDAAAPGDAGDGTHTYPYSVSAQVRRFDRQSGLVKISAGFPFPPGLVTDQLVDDREIRVIVDGSEVAASVTALRGRHNDGSVRSVLIQFDRNLGATEVLPAQVVVGEERNIADIAYERPTDVHVQRSAVILPSEPDYLCASMVALQHLVPVGQADQADEDFYTSFATLTYSTLVSLKPVTTGADGWFFRNNDNRALGNGHMVRIDATVLPTGLDWKTVYRVIDADASKFRLALTSSGPALTFSNPGTDVRIGLYNVGTASYDHPRGLVGLWARTGDVKYYYTAMVETREWLKYNTPGPDQSAIPQYPYVNPDNRQDGGGGNTGLPAEWHFSRLYSYASAYLLTGYRDYWSVVATIVQWQQARRVESEAEALANVLAANYSQRSSYAVNYAALLAASMIDATTPIPIQWGNGNRHMIYADQFEWTISALIALRWNAPGAFNDGLLGVRQTSTGDLPVFQIMFPSQFLIDYYLYVKGDERIPALIKNDLDITLACIRPLIATDWGGASPNFAVWPAPLYGYSYLMSKGPTPNMTSRALPWTFPDHAKQAAFVARKFGGSFQGVSYDEWYRRLINPSNVSPNHLGAQWKLFGQFMGFNQDAPWMMKQAQGSLQGAVYREPTFYGTIPQ